MPSKLEIARAYPKKQGFDQLGVFNTNGTAAMAPDEYNTLVSVDEMCREFLAMGSGTCLYTWLDPNRVRRNIFGMDALPMNAEYNSLPGSVVLVFSSSGLTGSYVNQQETKTAAVGFLEMENISLKQQIADLEIRVSACKADNNLLKLRLEGNNTIGFALTGSISWGHPNRIGIEDPSRVALTTSTLGNAVTGNAVTKVISEPTGGADMESVPASNQDELKYFGMNYEAILQRYNGQWIAIANNTIVAHGASYEEVYEITANEGLLEALIIKADAEAWRPL